MLASPRLLMILSSLSLLLMFNLLLLLLIFLLLLNNLSIEAEGRATKGRILSRHLASKSQCPGFELSEFGWGSCRLSAIDPRIGSMHAFSVSWTCTSDVVSDLEHAWTSTLGFA